MAFRFFRRKKGGATGCFEPWGPLAFGGLKERAVGSGRRIEAATGANDAASRPGSHGPTRTPDSLPSVRFLPLTPGSPPKHDAGPQFFGFLRFSICFLGKFAPNGFPHENHRHMLMISL